MRIRAGRRSRRNGGPHDHGATTERLQTRKPVCSPRFQEHVTRLVVDVGNRASAWRHAAVDAELAFAWWKDAAEGRRREAAAVYLAAIEREEKAANEYSRALNACCSAAP
jgi:hypothetical protein